MFEYTDSITQAISYLMMFYRAINTPARLSAVCVEWCIHGLDLSFPLKNCTAIVRDKWAKEGHAGIVYSRVLSS
jgi:hypothetical protein